MIFVVVSRAREDRIQSRCTEFTHQFTELTPPPCDTRYLFGSKVLVGDTASASLCGRKGVLVENNIEAHGLNL